MDTNESMKDRIPITIDDVADTIKRANYILIATGAGFSADSGLPVYKDIANIPAYRDQGYEYHELCDPYLLREEEDLFYGFWGDCLNSYRDTEAHEGYNILRKWKDQFITKHQEMHGIGLENNELYKTMEKLQAEGKISSRINIENVSMNPFFIYTSNVDAHFHRYFNKNEIYELHGNIEIWQCAQIDKKKRKPECSMNIWNLPKETRISVDTTTQKANNPIAISVNDVLPTQVAPCAFCSGLPRPNILMFNDSAWIPNIDDEAQYVVWEAAVEDILINDPSQRLVILEIGCGTRVPSVRVECHNVAADIKRRTNGRNQVDFIRINPIVETSISEHFMIESNEYDAPYHLVETGLQALKDIDVKLLELNS